MNLADFSRLKKFMDRSMSDNDHEALAALRQANKILTTYGYTWSQALSRVIQVVDEVESATDYGDEEIQRPSSRPGATQHALIDRLFDEAMVGAGGSFLKFLMSLKEQWDETHSLSPSQREALERAAERGRSRRR